MNWEKLIIPGIIFVVFSILAIRYYIINRKINSYGTYVIGRRVSISSEGETGSVFYYKFIFKETEHKESFADPFFKYNSIDTLLYFKIFSIDPKIHFIPIKDTIVPRCFKYIDSPPEGWIVLPEDTCGDHPH